MQKKVRKYLKIAGAAINSLEEGYGKLRELVIRCNPHRKTSQWVQHLTKKKKKARARRKKTRLEKARLRSRDRNAKRQRKRIKMKKASKR